MLSFSLLLPFGCGKTVADFTSHFSKLRNKLGNVGAKDEGLVVREDEGAKGLQSACCGQILSCM